MQAHADNLEMQSNLVASEPAKVQVAVKARSLHAQAQSLEAQADAQTLQVLLLSRLHKARITLGCVCNLNSIRRYICHQQLRLMGHMNVHLGT